MRFIPHVRSRTLSLLVLVGLFAFAGAALPEATRKVTPFTYKFRVMAVTATATFTSGNATTKSRIRIAKPSRIVKMTWLGPGPAGQNTGGGTWNIPFTGDAVYTSSDPKCNRTLKLSSAGSVPIVLLFYGRYSNRPIYALVRKFPLATGYPTMDDGTCGRFRKDWWDDASHSYRFSLLMQKGFVMTAHRKVRFEDGSGTMEWTLQLTVKRVSFRWL